MLTFSVPPGYRRSGPPVLPKLDAFVGIIDWILEDDKVFASRTQKSAPGILIMGLFYGSLFYTARFCGYRRATYTR